MLDRHVAVAKLVLDHSECAEVFQRHRIDFCCRGEMSIDAAARERGVDVDALMGELDRAVAERRGERAPDPRELSTPGLIAHVISTHHDYLRRALPFVATMAAKVARVHGDHNPKLRELDAAVRELVDTLSLHLDQEEQALFPELTAKQPEAALAGQLFAAMVEEHLAVAKLLERIRAATDDFTLPDWACNSYRALFGELAALESDTFTHVHLENHVLRPRFTAPSTPAAVA